MERSPFFDEYVLWQRNDDDAFCRAIPSINLTAANTLLAFSEARIHDADTVEADLMYDEIPSHITCKRSTDLGRTWSESVVLERANGAWWKQHGRNKLESWSQATSVVDRTTGRIFVFFVLNEGEHEEINYQRFSRVFFRTSDDDGLTWSDRTEITGALNCRADNSCGPAGTSSEGFASDHIGRAFHICIGHGIQHSTGRLIVPFWSRRTVAHPPEERLYGITPVASDDGGESWRVLVQTGFEHFLTEHRFVELDDGSLYLNGRTDRPDISDYRMSQHSYDGGETWTEPVIDHDFGRSYRCDAGVAYAQGNLVVTKGSSLENRSRMTASLSQDQGASWYKKRVIHDGGAFYSDLVALPDGSFGLIYLKHTLNTWRGRDVVFTRFNVPWITQR